MASGDRIFFQTYLDSENKLNADFTTSGSVNAVVSSSEKSEWDAKASTEYVDDATIRLTDSEAEEILDAYWVNIWDTPSNYGMVYTYVAGTTPTASARTAFYKPGQRIQVVAEPARSDWELDSIEITPSTVVLDSEDCFIMPENHVSIEATFKESGTYLLQGQFTFVDGSLTSSGTVVMPTEESVVSVTVKDASTGTYYLENVKALCKWHGGLNGYQVHVINQSASYAGSPKYDFEWMINSAMTQITSKYIPSSGSVSLDITVKVIDEEIKSNSITVAAGTGITSISPTTASCKSYEDLSLTVSPVISDYTKLAITDSDGNTYPFVLAMMTSIMLNVSNKATTLTVSYEG